MAFWITVNRACNIRCSWCYARETNYISKDQMSIEDLNKVLSFIIDSKDRDIIILGGEPTVYPHLEYLLKECKKNNLYTTLVTNGLKLKDMEYLKKLYEVGLDQVDISIKASSNEEYKKDTGVAAFDDVMVAIRNLKKLKKEFTCSMVITKETVKSFVHGAEFAFKNGCTSLNMSFVYDFNMSLEKDPNYLDNNNPFELINNFCLQFHKLNKITKGRFTIENGYPLCVYTDEQLNLLKDNMISSCQLLENNGILFDTDLSIIPCNLMYKIKVGKLGEDFNTYEEFINFKKSEKYTTPFNLLRSLPSEVCLECNELKYCGGGCTCLWTNTSFDELMTKKYNLIEKMKVKHINELKEKFRLILDECNKNKEINEPYNLDIVSDESVGVIRIKRTINRHCKWIKNRVLKYNRKTDLVIEKNSLKKIVLVLESPHIKEFDEEYGNHPALGTTGEKINNLFPDLLNRYIPTTIDSNYNSLYDSKYDILDDDYEIILVNPIQFQCSQGLQNKNIRNNVFEKCLGKRRKNEIFAVDFQQRISYINPDIIINCSTSDVKNIVWSLIDELKLPSTLLLESTHPSVWDIKTSICHKIK